MNAMTETSAPAPLGLIQPASRVLQEDDQGQSLIQGHPTLAYASLLVRQQRYDLAKHSLHSVENSQGGKYRDIVFCLQAQIEIETGLFTEAKARLVARLRENPGDRTALSLLQAAIQAELEMNPELLVSAPREEIRIPTLPPKPKADPPIASKQVLSASVAAVAEVKSSSEVLTPGRGPKEGHAAMDPELMPFQTVVLDPGTKGFAVWGGASAPLHRECRDPRADAVILQMAAALPGGLAHAVASLDAGKPIKICLAFADLTVTTLHNGDFHCGVVTGPLNQSLITVVRTETLFHKRASQLAAQPGSGDGAN